MRKVADLNQKGGVGKTIVTVNLAYGLAQAGKRTLVIDLDPQANATAIYGPKEPKDDKTVKEIFDNRKAELGELISPATVHGNPVENLFIVPSNIHLAVTAERMISQHHREKRLDTQLERLGHEYDFVLLDCPPNLGVLTVNAMYTADQFLIPTNYGKRALDGIADLLNSIEDIREGQDTNWRIVRNGFDSRNQRTNDYIENQLQNVRSNVLQTRIRKCEAINQADIDDEPVFIYDPKGHGTEDFQKLTQEILDHG